MSKGLKALYKLVSHIETEAGSDDYYEAKNARDVIEKELLALDIIKEIWRISFFDEEQRITIDDCYSMIYYDKEKYDLLKEALQ